MSCQCDDGGSSPFELEWPRWIRHVGSPADFVAAMVQDLCSDNGPNEARAELTKEWSEMQRSFRVDCLTPRSWRRA